METPSREQVIEKVKECTFTNRGLDTEDDTIVLLTCCLEHASDIIVLMQGFTEYSLTRIYPYGDSGKIAIAMHKQIAH